LDFPDQPGEVAEALSRLLDKNLRADIGAKGRELAKGLTWDKTTQETLAVYHRIMRLKESQPLLDP
jgi:glycosyltransferase involved in cell wall biosynthesis